MVRAAIIGLGRWGRSLVNAVHGKTGAIRFVAAHSRTRTSAEDFLNGKNIPLADSYEAILADKSIDAVVLATPHSQHADQVIAATRAGKHIHCEKPLTLDLASATAAVDAAKKAGLVLAVGFNRRFDPSFREVKERVAKGEVGILRSVRITSRDPQPPPASYLEVSGGMFKDMTIHDLDQARFQLGEIVEVSAVASDNGLQLFKEAKDHAQAIVTMRAASGALATIVNSRACAYGYDQRLELFGDAGSLEAGNWTATTVRAANATQTDAAGPILNFFLERYMPAFKAEFDEFVQAIKADRAPAVGFADGRAALVLAEAANESVATGRVVKLG